MRRLRRVDSGEHLCALCQAKVAAAHGKQRLTDEQVRQLINNGSMAAIVWAGDHI